MTLGAEATAAGAGRARQRLTLGIAALAALATYLDTTILFVAFLEAGLAVAPSSALAAVLAARFGKLAGQIGQRPLVVLGGLIVGLVFPQATSVAVQALPANRVGVGGATQRPRISSPGSTASGGSSLSADSLRRSSRCRCEPAGRSPCPPS